MNILIWELKICSREAFGIKLRSNCAVLDGRRSKVCRPEIKTFANLFSWSVDLRHRSEELRGTETMEMSVKQGQTSCEPTIALFCLVLGGVGHL